VNRTVKIGFASLNGGLGGICLGVALLLFQVGIEGTLLALPIAFISLGVISTVLGLIMLVGRLVMKIMARKNPDYDKEIADSDKEIDILEGDERNIAISRRAMSTTFGFTQHLDKVLLIFLMVMQVELAVTLVFLAALVAKAVINVLLRHKYNREM